jgi:hypothetical protein
MGEMIDRLKGKARKEIVYSRGYQVMQRERYMEYVSDMKEARDRGDTKRQCEIAQDLQAFTVEMWHLMEAQRSAYRRIYGLTAGHQQHSDFIADTATAGDGSPQNAIHPVIPRREDGSG